ncbi:MAG TPA: DUF1343 domain-containing protein [Balneolaceae bacterium]|nr:DUF1343 domain-containing protein [Balneolaceae bacterium]
MRAFPAVAYFCLAIFFQGCSFAHSQPQPAVKVGAKVLLDEYLPELKGKRVGLVMNPTARVDGSHMLDTLLARGVNVTALFAPEHGFRGDMGAGETIRNGVDQATGLPVFSLYGKTREPTPKMLKKVDLLLFDMQDVGARFYTYNSTLGNVIEAAAAQHVPVWVLDRPNPAGGNYISGWMMHGAHKSFVGKYPIPMAHGMTLGELAKMMVGERWIKNAYKAEVRVIPMKGWRRSMKWPDTGLKWIPPSPNLPSFAHAFVYLGNVFFEGTNISEGRGTPDPFLTIGAPTTQLTNNQIAKLNADFAGVRVVRTTFTPKSIPGKSMHPDFEGQQCHGVKIRVANPDELDPIAFGAQLLKEMLKATPDAHLKNYIQKLSGIDKQELLNQLKDGSYLDKWKQTARKFAKERKPYLLYD